MEINELLKKMIDAQASDLYITVGMPPSIRVSGDVFALSTQPLSEPETEKLVLSMMRKEIIDEYHAVHEANFAYGVRNIGRFRVSAFIQRNSPGCVIRHVPFLIRTIDELKLPSVVKALSMVKKGLILVVGTTGAGKSTSLAAMIEARNTMATGHIVTIEDPIEYLHSHKKCIITQREVGLDTVSFQIALKNALRQSPDVIQIGEIRDSETMSSAITFAETGHLCLSTLHANNVVQALERIAHFFPIRKRDQLWMDLSHNLRAIIAQKLVKRVDGTSRIVAAEILINTPIISHSIRKGEIFQLSEYMNRKDNHGMQTFDQSLFKLYSAGEITEAEAIKHADSENNLRLMIKLDSQVLQDMDTTHLSLEKNR